MLTNTQDRHRHTLSRVLRRGIAMSPSYYCVSFYLSLLLLHGPSLLPSSSDVLSSLTPFSSQRQMRRVRKRSFLFSEALKLLEEDSLCTYSEANNYYVPCWICMFVRLQRTVSNFYGSFILMKRNRITTEGGKSRKVICLSLSDMSI